MLGVKRDGVFFSRLLSGRNTPGKYGKGPSCDEEADSVGHTL